MNVIDDIWFGNIGVVIVVDKFGKERKAYIGVGQGYDRAVDVCKIVQWGYPLPREILKELYETLEPMIDEQQPAAGHAGLPARLPETKK